MSRTSSEVPSCCPDAGVFAVFPDRLPGFQHVEIDEFRTKFERRWGVKIPPVRGWHLSEMFEAMERGEFRALYVLGENPLQSEADQAQTRPVRRVDQHRLAEHLQVAVT